MGKLGVTWWGFRGAWWRFFRFRRAPRYAILDVGPLSVWLG